MNMILKFRKLLKQKLLKIIILVFVFEIFKREFMISSEFEPYHYFSTPGYSWNATLRFTGTNLKLISDTEK